MGGLWGSRELVKRERVKRRSEVDRRLQILVGPSGRLQEPSFENILRLLRLFNLCDIAPPVMAPDIGLPMQQGLQAWQAGEARLLQSDAGAGPMQDAGAAAPAGDSRAEESQTVLTSPRADATAPHAFGAGAAAVDADDVSCWGGGALSLGCLEVRGRGASYPARERKQEEDG